MSRLISPSGNPEHGKEGDEEQPYDLEPVEPDDEVPTDRAIVRFEKEGFTAEANLPGWAAGMFLTVAGPPLTLHSLPESFPAWMMFVLVLAQLAATVYVVAVRSRRGPKPRRKLHKG